MSSGFILLLVVFMVAGTPDLKKNDRSTQVLLYDIGVLSYDEQVLFFTLQGILNRDGPSLFFDTQHIFWTYPQADAYWIKYLSKEKNIEFQTVPSQCQIISHFQDRIKGLIIYDPSEDATRFVAVTISSQQNYIPVTTQILNSPLWNCLKSIPTKDNLSYRWQGNDTKAVMWALENLLPLCDKSLVFSAGHSHDDFQLGGDPAITIGLDYVVLKKGFVFNLSPASKPFNIDGKDYPGYPKQAELFSTVLNKLGDVFGIYGWAEPEAQFVNLTSSCGGYIMCDAAPNLSFWSVVPVETSPKLPNNINHFTLDPKKYYLTFMTNEADTPKIVAGLFGGEWVNPQRGSVPIGWGINPLIGEEYPALVEHFVKTATPNDTFFAGCSGAGYTYPWQMPNFEAYATHVGTALKNVGPNIVDVWEGGLNTSNYLYYKTVAEKAGGSIEMFTQEPVPVFSDAPPMALNTYLLDKTPLYVTDKNLFYYPLSGSGTFDDFEARVMRVVSQHKPPFFILAYGGIAYGPSPHVLELAIEMRKRLSPNNVQIIGAQDLVQLAIQAGKL